ncbi:MAG: FAD-binding oxidoreductase [Gemmatimonadetes bacterium]|nr:FAD-binding oxidoreductase [Gemmatimonadota bacterium]
MDSNSPEDPLGGFSSSTRRDHRPWGRLQKRATDVREIREGPVEPYGPGPVLTYGNGRSYGDSCMNGRGTLLDARPLNRILDFDPASGVLRAEAGTLLGDVLSHVVPHGWFLPVSPGTRWITLGGAVANDVHGKNHHVAGTFGRHVRRLELLRSDARRIVCGPDLEAEWFAATVGGLGLTGTMLWVEIQLIPIANRGITVRTTRFGSLSEFFEISKESGGDYAYTVSWIDCLARGANLGRGRFMAGNHASPEEQPPRPRSRRLDVFIAPPLSVINRWSVRLFNAVYHRAPAAAHAVVDYEPFFYPLDAVSRWNRIYGPRGFFQFQCVVPPEVGEDAMRELLTQIGDHGEASFLVVLKEFGDLPSPGLLSFPRAGPTLALDFPNRGSSTLRLLETLERITMEAGGALYPAKDACMSPESFRGSYPRWEELERRRDPAYISDFWCRVTGIEPARGPT